jgi:hypothetical protein
MNNRTYTYRIEQDDFSSNPRDEFDNLSTFYGVSGRYLVGGKNDHSYHYRNNLNDEIKALRKAGAVIVEFESNAGTCYAVVEESQLQNEYIKHGYTMRKAKYWARHCAQGEINTWLAWGNGEVYGYIVEDQDGAHVDSCWGFYGEDGRKDAEQEAKSIIEWHIENDQEQERLINISFAI